MFDMFQVCRALLVIVLVLLMLIYTMKLLSKFKKSSAVLGKVFLRGNLLLRVTSSLAVALLLIVLSNLLIYNTAFLGGAERITTLTEYGGYTASLSLIFFLYAIYEFYEMIK